jgi:hypothetical protein
LGRFPRLKDLGLGRPRTDRPGCKTKCSRCEAAILKGHLSYVVPQPKKPHSSTRRFCVDCFAGVLEQTRQDLEKLGALSDDAQVESTK